MVRPPLEQSSPRLPFNLAPERPRNASSDQPRPTAFISYSHETRHHKERVRDLADRLRTEGVDCEIDEYHVSPPEGWPLWMQKQIEKSDFIIVVYTETYGKGKGSAWEGRSIHQVLYDAVENHRVIPIVFDREDIRHIPLAFKSATRYVLDDDYSGLHRALTNQPRIEKPPVGPLRRRLPDLRGSEAKVVALLSLCPDPLPLEVVVRVLGRTATDVSATLQRLVRIKVVKIDADSVRLDDRSVDGIPDPVDNMEGAALGAELEFVASRSDVTRKQVRNVVSLASAADINVATVQISRTFRSIQSFLKSFGDKRLVLKVARRSIEASKLPGRGRAQVKDEAVAAICGVSWVYQRTGRLSEARAEAERSLALGQDIGWNKNTHSATNASGA